MSTRRYESGKLVSESHAAVSRPAWAKKDDTAKPVVEKPAASEITSHSHAPNVAPGRLTTALPDSTIEDVAQAVASGHTADSAGELTTPATETITSKGSHRPPPAPREPATDSTPSAPLSPPPVDTAFDRPILDTSDMRKFLLQQMVRAARGEITSETVKNIVTLSQQVYNATSLEIKAAAILKDNERSIRALTLVSQQPRAD